MNQRKVLAALLATALAVGFVSAADARLAANRLAANKLAANGLAQVSDGAVNDVLAIQLRDGALFTR